MPFPWCGGWHRGQNPILAALKPEFASPCPQKVTRASSMKLAQFKVYTNHLMASSFPWLSQGFVCFSALFSEVVSQHPGQREPPGVRFSTWIMLSRAPGRGKAKGCEGTGRCWLGYPSKRQVVRILQLCSILRTVPGGHLKSRCSFTVRKCRKERFLITF